MESAKSDIETNSNAFIIMIFFVKDSIY